MPKALQLDENSVVVGTSLLSQQFDHPSLLWVPEDTPDVMGTTYDSQAKTFTAPAEIDPETEEVVIPEQVVHTLP